MATDTHSETAIFERVVLPDSPKLPLEVARYLLSLGFGPEDKERMRILSAKAREATLSASEEDEIEGYERIGHYLAILQSHARVAVREAGHDGG
jgi:hypothetical protein